MLKAISLLASLVFASGLLPAAAQEARSVSFRVICYQYVKDTKYVVLPAPGGAPLKIPLPTSGFGEETKGSFADGMVRFYAEGKTDPPQVLAEGKLASGNRQVFLLLPSPDPKLLYRVYALSDEEAAFPMGSTRVLNIGAVKIRLNVSGTDLPPIEPGALATYPLVKAVDDWKMYPVRVDMETAQGDWKAISSQSWKALDSMRTLVIASLDPKTRRPSIKSYQDIPPWRQAPPAAVPAQ